jgi:hypothetical protein
MRRAIVTSGALGIGLSGCLLFTSLSDLSDNPGTEADSGNVDAPADGPNVTDGDGVRPDSALDAGADAALDADAAANPGVPAFVQVTASASPADASVATATFEAGVAPGNAIVVALGYAGSSVSVVSINDTQNDTFVPVFDTTGINGNRYWLRAAVGVAGGPTNVTVQLDAPVSGGIELYVHEYADVSAIGVATGASGTTKAVDGMQTSLLTTTVPNELVFCYGTSVTGAAVAGTAFTPRSRFHSNVTEDRIAPTPGAYRAIGTMTSGTEWALIGATFKPK